MNDEAAPLQPEELDEVLSADIDGELAAAASDRGCDDDVLRARIAATPGSAARREALVAARRALADAPQLDELVAARLRAKAVQAAEAGEGDRRAAQPRRRKQRLLTASGIAAAILVFAAVAVALRHSGSSTSKSSSAGGTSNSSGAPPRVVHGRNSPIDLTSPEPALGSYTDVATLGSDALDNAEQRAALKRLPEVAGAAGPIDMGPLQNSQSTPLPAGVKGGSSNGRSAARNDSSALRPTATSQYALGESSPPCTPAKYAAAGEQLSLHASAKLNGRPVDVFVYAGPGEHTVVVLSPGCRLVNVLTTP
jgi:hypothetical protein